MLFLSHRIQFSKFSENRDLFLVNRPLKEEKRIFISCSTTHIHNMFATKVRRLTNHFMKKRHSTPSLSQNLIKRVLPKTQRYMSSGSTELKERLAQLIPEKKTFLQNLAKEHGHKSLGEVTVNQALGGARGVKCMVWETSLLDPEEVRFSFPTPRRTFRHNTHTHKTTGYPIPRTHDPGSSEGTTSNCRRW